MMGGAVVIVLCQVILMAMMARFLRDFHRYTAAIVAAQESNRILYQQAIKVLEYASDMMSRRDP